jgi:hypothetical protein
MRPSNLLGSSYDDGDEYPSQNDYCSDNNALYVKNLESFDQYFPGYGWFPNDPMDPTLTYKALSEQDGEVVLVGAPMPVDTEISILEGWNWISYLPQEVVDVPTAMGSVLDVDNDGVPYSKINLIKTQEAFTEYFVGYGWFGAFDYMNAGVGYVMRAGEDAVLQYPNPDDFIGSNNDSGECINCNDELNRSSNQIWEVNSHDYQYNGSVAASVSIDGIKATLPLY